MVITRSTASQPLKASQPRESVPESETDFIMIGDQKYPRRSSSGASSSEDEPSADWGRVAKFAAGGFVAGAVPIVGALTNGFGAVGAGLKFGDQVDHPLVALAGAFGGGAAGVMSHVFSLALASNASSLPAACLAMLPSAVVGALSWAYVGHESL